MLALALGNCFSTASNEMRQVLGLFRNKLNDKWNSEMLLAIPKKQRKLEQLIKILNLHNKKLLILK